MATAFVYCWTDKATNMVYIGSHKGSVDDGYICSSKYMLEEYNKRPDDFSRKIIATGNVVDIRNLETRILQAFNAKENSMFYNKHQNDGLYFDGWAVGQMSIEHRQKLSAAKKGKPISKAHKEKLHTGRRNSKNSESHKKALIESRLGSTHTEEAKKKMSVKKLLNPRTSEIAKNAGTKSAASRPANYSEVQSQRMKLWWAERKKLKGE